LEIIPLTRSKARLSEIVARLLYRKGGRRITRQKVPVAGALVPYDQWARKNLCEGRAAAAAGALADLDAEIDERTRSCLRRARPSQGTGHVVL